MNTGRSGRGPTTDMSPRTTLMNCGNSSRLVRRRNAPNRVGRLSPFWAQTGPVAASQSTGIEHPAGLVKPVHRQGDEHVIDLVLADQDRQVGQSAEDVQVARPTGRVVLDEADVPEAHPGGGAQGGGRLPGRPAGADDDAER